MVMMLELLLFISLPAIALLGTRFWPEKFESAKNKIYICIILSSWLLVVFAWSLLSVLGIRFAVYIFSVITVVGTSLISIFYFYPNQFRKYSLFFRYGFLAFGVLALLAGGRFFV